MLARRHLLIFAIIFASVIASALAWTIYDGSDRTAQPQIGQTGSSLRPTAAAAMPKLSPLPARPLSAKTRALRSRAAETAAKGRALAWLHEPGMVELTGWEYGTRTGEMAQVLGGDELQNLGRLASAGGVLPDNLDLASLAASFTALSAGATYSPFDKQILLVNNTRPSESLLVHEMTHALQDQHFDLLPLVVSRPYSYDTAEAAFAVVEGDAVGVQRRFEQTANVWNKRTLDEIARREDERFGEYRTTIGALFPSLLVETFIFRYRDGTRFVEGVRRRRGQAGVDELFRRPPASSEQVLHLDKYLAGESPRPITFDDSSLTDDGWRQTASSAFGEIGVRGALAERLDAKETLRAAAGWGNDSARLFERAGEMLFKWQTAWDTEQDAAEFFAAYNLLQQRRGAESLGADDRQATWRDSLGRVTIVRRDKADGVLVLRGTKEALDL